MKSMEKRARILAINSWYQSVGTVQEKVLEALKEQDKITRHACAKEVFEIGVLDCEPTGSWEKGFHQASLSIHQAIMNVNIEKE